MYSDFFDPPDDAANDKKGDDADKTDEGLDYSSGDELGDISIEEHSDKDKDDDEISDDNSADVPDDDDDNEQPPLKKAKHKLLSDE